MEFYFITYQAKNNQGGIGIWNAVIDCTPMRFILDTKNLERDAGGAYSDFIVTNVHEITEEDFKEFKDMISEGWQPIGGISHTYVAGDKEEYIQAMVRYEGDPPPINNKFQRDKHGLPSPFSNVPF